MPNMLQVRTDARPECIRPVRDAVARFGSETGLSSVQAYAVKLCVGEAITNAVRHAYPERKRGPVDVSAQEVGDDLVVTVADHGTRRRLKPGTHTDDEGGFGLAFISRLTEGITFTAARDGTRVEMHFPLSHGKAPATSGQPAPPVPSQHHLAVRVQ
jgi:anti-sigma regulatory factor (Ser/Thr protein kinase)